MKELLKDLIRVNTVNSANGGEIGRIVKEYLEGRGAKFKVREFEFEGIKSFVYENKSEGQCELALCGHYDVVPALDWKEAFEAVEREGYIYGRGACDMKGGLAAIIEAFAQLSESEKRIMLLVLGDEEKGGFKGAERVLEEIDLPKRMILTEPFSVKELGDKMRIGARGVLFLRGKIKGKGGHASRPHLADNPINKAEKLIKKVKEFDGSGDDALPATTLSLTQINASGGAINVIPSELTFAVDCRYNRVKNREYVVEYLKEVCDEVEVVLDQREYINKDERLVEVVKNAIKEETGKEPLLSAEGGSSDGRFFCWKGCGVVEVGPVARKMHAKGECVKYEELEKLVRIVVKSAQRL